MVNAPAASPLRPDIVAKSRTRSYGGAVQAVLPAGVIRLRDDRLGDIVVVITTETRVSKNGAPAAFRNITVGTRIHGYASLRGERYIAQVATIE